MGDTFDSVFKRPRHDSLMLIAAVLALGAMASVFVAGGPVAPPKERHTPAVAKLVEVEKIRLRPPPPEPGPGEAYRPTMALVRLPDSAQSVVAYFGAMNYYLAQVREGGREVPRAYLAALPRGIVKVAPVRRRKALFIRAMLPLVLRANEEVLARRSHALTLRWLLARGEELEARDAAWLLDIAKRYRLPAESPAEVDMAKLLERLDVVPPSLAITQSILESGWGTSRFARKGNALFGQRTWDDDTPGLKPKAASGFKVRAFEDLGSSVRAYIHNLNTTSAYAQLRAKRARMRAAGERIDGYRLAAALQRYSEEGWTYVEKLRNLMAQNGLRAFDSAALRFSVIAQRIVPDSSIDEIRVALRVDE